MFVPMAPSDGWMPWESEVVKRNVGVLMELQGFLLEALMCWSQLGIPTPTPLPNLELFVADALELIDILRSPTGPISMKYSRETHPFQQVTHRRLETWNDRWAGWSRESSDKLRLIWEHYQCGLCDAIFGMWPAPGQNLFHKRCRDSLHAAGTNGCIGNILSMDMVYRRSTSAMGIEFRLFDAALIESHGPFRFEPTDRLDKHLTLDGKTIRYYADWRKWSFLSNHKVLRRAKKANAEGLHVSFDTLVNSERVRPSEIYYSSALLHISKDILVSNILYFHQATLRGQQRKRCANFRRCWQLIQSILFRCLPKFGMHDARSSRSIGKRVGVDLSDGEVVDFVHLFGTHEEDLQSLFNACMPFRERAIKLEKRLREWKPKTIWEMRYAGYGGVDPVGLYAFYFASVLGVLTIIGIGITAAQTFASFKALPSS